MKLDDLMHFTEFDQGPKEACQALVEDRPGCGLVFQPRPKAVENVGDVVSVGDIGFDRFRRDVDVPHIGQYAAQTIPTSWESVRRPRRSDDDVGRNIPTNSLGLVSSMYFEMRGRGIVTVVRASGLDRRHGSIVIAVLMVAR